MTNSKHNYSSTDFFKNREGPKRQARMNEWYVNKEGHKEAQKFFSATKDGVPNNPTNYQTFTPIASQFAPNSESDADVVFRRNPYGDAEQIEQSQGPLISANRLPTQWGNYGQGSRVDKNVDKPNFLQTPGPGSEMSAPRSMDPPRGMNTGISSFGAGARRNEARGGKKKNA